MSLPDDVRAACARVAARARLVRIDREALDRYELPLPAEPPALDPETHWLGGSREDTASGDLEIYSAHSPLGKAITGCRVGDSATYTLPNGREMTVHVTEIETYTG